MMKTPFPPVHEKIRNVIAHLGLACLLATPAAAITITYVNAGPLNSRVFVGFANDATGNLTGDFVMQPSAASRNDTVYGPLPPIGQLPSFEAMAYGAAELGTNLNAPLGTGVRSVFAPLNLTFFKAHGQTLAPTGFYSSHAFAHSGDTTSTTPTRWIIHVDPSGAEVTGTPANVTIAGSLNGAVTVAGSSTATATWNVSTTGFGTVMAGVANQTTPGATPFSAAGTITFSVPLGGTFELLVSYDLSTTGFGAGADSTSELIASLVQISAVIPPPVAPPYAVHFRAPLGQNTTLASPAGPFLKPLPVPVLFRLRDAQGDVLSDSAARALDVRIAAYAELPGGGSAPMALSENEPRYAAGLNLFTYELKTHGPQWIRHRIYRLVILINGAAIDEAFFELR